MENEILIDVCDEYPDSSDVTILNFRFKENNEKMQDFIDLCLEQNKYLVISNRFKRG